MISDPQSPFNGKNAPNLVKRFTYGVNAVSAIGSTAGNETASVTIQSSLSGTTDAMGGAAPPAWANTREGVIWRNQSVTNHRLAISSSDYNWNDGQHIHSLGGPGGAKAVGSASFSIMPPYFGLLKVLRIK